LVEAEFVNRQYAMASVMHVYSAERATRLVHALILVGASALSGCVTLIGGTTQRVTVVTDPPGAQCTLRAGGEGPWSVAETPGVVDVKRGRAPLEVACTKVGHLDAVERVASAKRGQASADTAEQQFLMSGSGTPLTVAQTTAVDDPFPLMGEIGNALIQPLGGSLIALPVDISSGAMLGYPPTIVVLMVPSEFPDERTRDAYFADREQRFEAAMQQRRQQIDAYCETESKYELVKWNCERLRPQEETSGSARRQWLAAQRAKTSVRAVTTESP